MNSTKNIAKLNKLTPAAKTSMILNLQQEAENQIQINKQHLAQIDSLIELKDSQIKTVAQLRKDIQLGQARCVSEEQMTSNLKSAFISMQAKYIQLLESKS